MSRPDDDRAVIVVAGPTASGKSALALELAERFGGEIVNADSMQVYRELRVLTARPYTADEARVPHHLYGILPISETCSAGHWLRLALSRIEAIWERDRLPVVCGGSGLYLKVLLEGIAPVPPVPDEVVETTRALFEREGGAAFRARLADVDPGAAEKLAPTDKQRLIRAYAVADATGRTLAEWQAGQSSEPPLDGRFFTIVLAPERAALYRRIDARFDAMVEAGAVEEVAALRSLGLDPDLPAMKALGVPDFLRHLDGECDIVEAVERAKQLTRNFAKRQTTWFRNQLPADLTIGTFGADALDDALPAVAAFLDYG